ncbi:hypothetical protein CIB48_g126 [Xylaria polymorpha]|nr:hypothetical protein CIB48_g126 [Xylaria polymorpha]
MASPLFILDVKEKEIAEAKPPSYPQIRSGSSGFPEHKKRSKVSAFKQKRQGPHSDDQKPKIAKNRQKLTSMSPQEIEQARQDLFNGLDPSILEMLLKRANLDEGANTLPLDQPQQTPEATSSRGGRVDSAPEIRIEDTDLIHLSTTGANNTSTSPRPQLSVSEEVDERDSPPKQTTDPTANDTRADDDSAPAIPPKEHIIEASPPAEAEGAHHWPRAPQPADLDPSDPNFLQNLHEKYFPSLPADPSKLAWMAPIPTPDSAADRDSPYYPGQDSLPISALRFDFRGTLLAPRIARVVPTTKGLHHHGEAPEAAGYTIRELARLARSAVPGQRCLAYQTLGRIMYRLGRGQFGGVARDDVSMGDLARGRRGRVLRSLQEEAGTEEGRGHRSARVFATEAIWLLEKGGWKEKLKKAFNTTAATAAAAAADDDDDDDMSVQTILDQTSPVSQRIAYLVRSDQLT